MDKLKREIISSRALKLVESHFEFLNKGDLISARHQLFHPPKTTQNPLDIYLGVMCQLRPFQIKSCSVKRFEDIRQKRHGNVATIWIDILVSCFLGEKSTEIIVWWFPESDICQISARPSHWIIELIKKKKSTNGNES